MQRSCDVSVCSSFWLGAGSYPELFSTLRSFIGCYPDVEISLCDDGSALAMQVPGVTITRLSKKEVALNPCVPLNVAVSKSTRAVVLLTNPGVEARPGLVESMLAAMVDDMTYVAAACRDVDTGRWLCHSTVRGGEYGRGPMPPGSGFHFCAMLTRSLWDKAGGFDEDYREGQAYDDNDFLWRLHRADAKFKVLDDVVIDHKRSTTVWPSGGLERNRALFERKWSNAA